jgi:type II secretory ATPase GspE/PulE/Tfp pilus assembly ATPase PilB-like protein
MPRFVLLLILSAGIWSSAPPAIASPPDVLLAQSSRRQDNSPIRDFHSFNRSEGGYLAWYKLAGIAAVLLMWISACEWVNKDVQRTTRVTRLTPEFWNPIMVFPFVGGFFAVLLVPFFWAGFPVYLLTAVLPFFFYIRTRNKLVEAEDTAFTKAHLRRKRHGIEGSAAEIVLNQDQGPVITFDPAGADDLAKKTNLIRARQGFGFVTLKGVMYETFIRRSPQLALNYTRDAVTIRCEVDGVWQDLPMLDRVNGDALLISLKFLAGLNPEDRRSHQTGKIKAHFLKDKYVLHVSTKGVQTGEQAMIRISSSRTKELALGELGMSTQVLADLKSAVNSPGLVVISAPTGHGLTTSWHAALQISDRLTRDIIALVDYDEHETDIENVELSLFDSRQPGSFEELLRATDLRQPDALVVPKIIDGKALDLLVGQVEKDRAVMTRTNARSATEVLLSLLSQSGQRRKCLSAITAITCQRLLRRLCTACRTPILPTSQQIQQLGGNPNMQYTLYMPYQPPAQPMLDAKGVPIPNPICQVCRGIGYVERIGAFELLKVDEAIEKAVIKSPKLEDVQAAARRMGHLTTVQASYQHVLNGVTAFPEIQRVFKS